MKLSYNDNKHAYWLDGKRCKSVTAVAGIPDDKFALNQWMKRTVVAGMGLSPSLVERAAAHYDDREQLESIAEDAMTAAKAHEAADRGTAAHRIVERASLGELVVDTPFARAVQEAWNTALKGAGLEVVPEYIERIVAYPELKLAGRFDQLCRRRRDGKLVVVDLKTGKNAIKYPHSIAVQLALYANAPALAGPIPGGGGVTEEFSTLPAKLDMKWGYIVAMPGDREVEVHKVDIAGGWDIAKSAIFPILKWRARRDLTKPVTSVEIDDSDTADEDRVAWIKGRISDLRTSTKARTMVARNWPAEVPVQGPWSPADINALDRVLAQAEREVNAGFPVQDPALIRAQGAAD